MAYKYLLCKISDEDCDRMCCTQCNPSYSLLYDDMEDSAYCTVLSEDDMIDMLTHCNADTKRHLKIIIKTKGE